MDVAYHYCGYCHHYCDAEDVPVRQRPVHTGHEPIELTPDDIGELIPELNCPRCDRRELRLEVPTIVCTHPGCGFIEYGVPVDGDDA